MAIGLDSFGISFLAKELKDLLTGYSVGSICLKEDKSLLIYLEGRRPLNLVFLAEPGLPLLCVSESLGRGDDLPHPPRLEEPLRKSVITDISQIELDRILLFSMSLRKRGLRRLYFELIPPFPNMFFTDSDDIVIEPLFRAGTRTRRRTLDRGDSYVPPPPPEKLHPADVTREVLDAADWRGDPEIISRLVTGVSPFLSRELAARAEGCGSIYEAFISMLADYREGRSAPCVFRISPSVSKSPPRRGIAWFRPHLREVSGIAALPTLNDAVEALTSEFLALTGAETLRALALKELSREIRRWRRISERAAKEQRERDQAGRLRKFGEILLANMGKVRRGAKEILLSDIYSSAQEELVIPLDPKLTPQANAEVYFKRARKTLRRAERSAAGLSAATARLDVLERLRKEAESPRTSMERMAEILDAVSKQEAKKREERQPVDERAEQLGIRPRRYNVTGGWTVLVGRSARENDTLTHRYAAPGDLWFHARQAQGSHVVLRRGKQKSQVSKQAIIQAASIAAYHSKARKSGTVPVSYTERRYVKKVRKGPPGTAAMLREKVIFVTPGLPPPNA